MKVEHKDNKKKPSINAAIIEVGQMFSGNPSGYEDSVYLKTLCGVVDLKSPRHVWAIDARSTLTIENFTKLDGDLTVWPMDSHE